MKKYLILLLSVICAFCVGFAIACDDDETHTHTWVATGSTDDNGNEKYVCSECGAEHTHTFSSTYTYDENGHWQAATCGHSDAKINYSEHVYDDDDSTVCSVCGYDSATSATYNLEFSYYRYDSDGTIESDETTGVYVTVGVTYTAVESSDGFLVDVENGDTVMAGDIISFTVSKSVFCYYTDDGTAPVVYVNDEAVTANSSGVYSFTVADDMASEDGDLIIWVGNVLTRASTIGGSGTQSDPYTINSVTDWLYFASRINEKDYYLISWNLAYWKLTCDLDFEGEEIYIVGDGYTSSYAAFMGYFDGGGHTLSNFVLTNAVSGSEGSYTNYLGLFGVCSVYEGYPAVITNLNVENFTLEANCPSDNTCFVGSIVGYSVGFSITNCTVNGGTINVVGSSQYSSMMGGIAGFMQSYMFTDSGLISYATLQYDVVTDCEITGTNIIYSAGGLVGYTASYSESAPVYIINSYASGVTVSGGVFTGGIAGILGRYSSIQNSYATGSVIANSTFTETSTKYKGSELDYRYARAGGIVGFAENDTYIGGCFFVGTVSASSSAGSAYTQKGAIYGDMSEAGFEEYYSSAAIIANNLHNNETYNSTVTKDALLAVGWNDIDWNFSGTYPAINSEEDSYTYTITIKIGTETITVDIDSTTTAYTFAPMAYRYLLGDQGDDGGISIYLRSENSRTYGYFFDEDCTQRVPAGYVAMSDVTLYAKYVDCSAIIDKEYYITSNGVTATIILYANGIYSYSEGAVYVEGDYEYDGTTITFKNSYFSRLSSGSDDQKASYYTFYATISANGDLEIFDGEDVVTNADYDYLARFFAKDDPLVAAAAENVSFSGSYYGKVYYDDGEAGNSYEFVFYKGYSGTYYDTRYSSTTSTTLTYSVSNGVVTVKLDNYTYTGTVTDGKLATLTLTTNSEEYITLTAYDDFKGTWEQEGIVSKVYTFDGKNSWTYTDGNGTDSGTYTVSEGKATFTRTDGTVVTVTVNEDGTLNVTEENGTDSVLLVAENSLAGVWYMAAEKETRYTFTLSGINADGWGEATFEEDEGFRYYVYSAAEVEGTDSDGKAITYTQIILYMYYGDTLYAQITYTSDTNILTGLFYNTSTGELDTSYTFYQYDVFYGSWVSNLDEFATISFNGYGLYSLTAEETGGLAVGGIVTVNGDSTKTAAYTVDVTTGIATFTYNNVTYTLTYDEYTDSISVTYAGGTAKIAHTDKYADVVFTQENGTAYVFDGRGELGTGTVTITSGDSIITASYAVSGENDTITITYTDGSTATISCGNDGYVIDGTALYVLNNFTGTWAVYGEYLLLVIDDIRFIPADGGTITVNGKYGDTAITLTYNGSTMSFKLGTGADQVTYYITARTYGLAISTAEVYYEGTYVYAVTPDALFGTWTYTDSTTSTTTTITFDGTAGTVYVTDGSVKVTVGETETTGTYYVENGVYYVVVDDTTDKYTIETTSSDSAYTSSDHSGYYLTPVVESAKN